MEQKTSPTSRLGLKSVIYHGETCLGEVEITLPAKNQHFQFPNNEIRINHLSQPSERCPPLSVLQTIAPYAIRCKLESKFTNEHSLLYRLYSACFQELKTAVVLLGGKELHLVAMGSREERFPCFWCFAVPLGLYQNCLGMLNLRCLSIVFDLDETLIVANTMKSFEDKIEALQRRIACDNDPLRVSGMTAEMRRYMEDRSILKQYAEADYVMDNGKLLKVQLEEVPPVSGQQERVVRPVIRLPDRNIVLTRINPEIRDTSVLVRLRPAWEDLRSYLTAKGRKRFEVYVCTMAEKDYALEIWRLLDPEAHLISSKQLMDRVVCVKSGSRKSLLNVFQDCICHPKMAMVIDDRLKVWDDKDQPRVHVVPPFTPYYAPQAETANVVPLLCVARNVACNVRAGFFKEFDENLLRKIAELCYEDEVTDLPYAPDVSDYLMPEDASFVPNINREIPISEGMNGTEVDRRMNPLDDKNIFDSSSHHVTNNRDSRPDSKQPAAISENLIEPDTSRTVMTLQKPSVLGAGKREVNPSELDHEARKRLLVMHPGQNVRDQSSVDAALLPRPSPIQPRGGWLVEEDMNLQHISNRPSGLTEESGPSDPQQAHHVPLGLVPSHVSQVKNEQAYNSHERQKQKLPQSYSQQAHQNLHPPSVESSAPSGIASHASQVKTEQTYVRHGRQIQSVSQSDTQQAYQNLLPPGADGSVSIASGMNSHLSRVKNEQAYLGHERQRQSLSQTNQSSPGNGVVPNQTCTNNREIQTEAGKVMLRPLSVSIGVLQEIGRRCGSKVEFKSLVNTSKDLQFSIEVLFSGEKIGVGMGKTKKDAQQQAAEEALRCLADKYVAHIADSGGMDRALDKLSLGNENGFLLDNLSPGLDDQKPDITLPPNFSTEANVEEGVLKPVGNQQVRKRGSPPRSPQTISNKRSKEELLRGLPGLPSSQYQKNGNPIS